MLNFPVYLLCAQVGPPNVETGTTPLTGPATVTTNYGGRLVTATCLFTSMDALNSHMSLHQDVYPPEEKAIGQRIDSCDLLRSELGKVRAAGAGYGYFVIDPMEPPATILTELDLFGELGCERI